MKVLFIVPYPFNSAPSQRLKFEQYFSHFEKVGIRCIVQPFMSEAFYKIVYKKNMYGKKIFYTLCGYARRISRMVNSIECDLIYLHLEAAPFGPPVFEYVFKLLNKPIIYDIDDVVFLPHYSAANKLIKYIDNPRKTFSILKISSHIIVVTNYLKECALKYNKNVTFIPPTIDTDKYYVKKNYHKNGQICIGWSGSRTTSVYLSLLENVLKTLSKKYDVKIKVIGNADFKMYGSRNFHSQEWKLDSEVEDLHEIDIGLYPLPNKEWILGKGGLKALQYMGLGIPAVCSRIGACLEFIEDGVNGFLADTEDEWIEKLSLLIENPKLREKLGLAGRKTVEEKYSVKANVPKYLEIIQKVYHERYNRTG